MLNVGILRKDFLEILVIISLLETLTLSFLVVKVQILPVVWFKKVYFSVVQ